MSEFVLNRQSSIRVSLRTLEAFLARARRTLHLPKDSVTVCLLSDAEMARLNRRYRGKRGATDVLSFPAHDGAGKLARGAVRGRGRGARRQEGQQKLAPTFAGEYLGDVAIAPGVARRNARRFGRTLPGELRILILHGVLHLLGYDHATDNGAMERYEARLRRRLGLS